MKKYLVVLTLAAAIVSPGCEKAREVPDDIALDSLFVVNCWFKGYMPQKPTRMSVCDTVIAVGGRIKYRSFRGQIESDLTAFKLRFDQTVRRSEGPTLPRVVSLPEFGPPFDYWLQEVVEVNVDSQPRKVAVYGEATGVVVFYSGDIGVIGVVLHSMYAEFLDRWWEGEQLSAPLAMSGPLSDAALARLKGGGRSIE